MSQASLVALVAASLGNVAFGGRGVLQFLLLWVLLGPASIFVNTVRDLARGRRKDEPQE